MRFRGAEAMRTRSGEEAQSLLGGWSDGSGQLTVAMPEIVVLKVALHCQGCARRVKKVISKLKGVDTYDIDFDHQKVTVVGKVTPVAVLDSVTKVIKAAEFWPNGNNTMQPPAMEKGQQPPLFRLAPV